MKALLATHPHEIADEGIVVTKPQAPRLRVVTALPRVEPARTFALTGAHARVPVVASIVGLHVALVAALWFARPWVVGPVPPSRIEVALIAPPERARPTPPPPPKVRHSPVPPRPQQVAPIESAIATPLPIVAIVPPTLAPLPSTSLITTIEAPVVPVAPRTRAAIAPPLPMETVPPRFDASYLDNPAPRYPASAKRAGEEGRVMLRVLVSADGGAQSVEIAQTSGFDRLDAAAVDAVRRWRFVPARRGDAAVAAHVNVPVAFSLAR